MTDSALSDIGTLVQDIGDHIEAGQMCYQETKASLQKVLTKATKQEKPAGKFNVKCERSFSFSHVFIYRNTYDL